ncbi:SPOR domain-containing protein [Phaeobacter inhibens]|uniref:SPOR domain-containing protein n=1 Tax=Phaeobacter inhibens TaxID=221822 RepID=UPI0021A6F01E|nr:SPOR domain-containing protein [Phaeobacter inhibens]UWR54154.1 SPOR domain-containing protein [Phaeobacter inhibens]UWR69700.1 SPOR domain-containing protein [Phaeobacter inhibens]
MTLTRIIASALIAAASFGGAQAQSARTTEAPAEFPPASFEGKQYVDSRGCVFIRAGIDGNVTWVPRVTRSRKQLCGFEPTQVAAAPSAPRATSAPAPELITLPADQRANGAEVTVAEESVVPVGASTAPRSVTTTKPQRSAVRQAKPVRTVASTGRLPRQRPVLDDAYRPPTVAPTIISQGYGRCSGASALSQQYINQTGDVRCGPQGDSNRLSSVLDPNTRVVPKHVYQERALSRGLMVPEGYRRAWGDDRLNPRRAEMSLGGVLARANGGVPAGYVRVSHQDRYNQNRGPQGTAIWTRTVPREGIRRPVDRPVVTLSTRQRADAAADVAQDDVLVTRLSTRSQPLAETAPRREATAALSAPVAPSRYVRAATLADVAKAEAVAQRLRQKGLPVRLGRVNRQGQTLQVVLAGPFAGGQAAQSALSKVRAAGFAGARLSK